MVWTQMQQTPRPLPSITCVSLWWKKHLVLGPEPVPIQFVPSWAPAFCVYAQGVLGLRRGWQKCQSAWALRLEAPLWVRGSLPLTVYSVTSLCWSLD